MARNVAIASATACLVAVLAAGAWYTYTDTPRYALGQIHKAVESGDELLFDRHMDVDALVDGAVDDLLAFTMARMLKDDLDGFEALGAALGGAMVEGMRPVLKASAKEAIREGLQRRDLEGALEDEGGNLTVILARLADTSFGGLGEVERLGGVARVGLRMHDPILDETLLLTLRMEKEARAWKVRRIDNLKDFLETQARLQDEHLERINAELLAEMALHINVGPLSRRIQNDGWFSRVLFLEAAVENIGTSTIGGVVLDVYGSRGRFDRGESALLAQTLEPGERGTARRRLELNQFIEAHEALASGRVRLVPSAISVVEEGTSRGIQTYYTWEHYMAARNSGQYNVTPKAAPALR